MIENYETTPNTAFKQKIENIFDLLLSPEKFPHKVILTDKNQWKKKEPNKVSIASVTFEIIKEKVITLKNKHSQFFKIFSSEQKKEIKKILNL